MSEAMHPLAPHDIPAFITAPGQADILFIGAVTFFIILVLVIGSFYFWLHSLPERIAHGTSHLQFQLVAVLALLALFTHINAFWVAALLLALVPIPDFWTPLATMAESLAKMAGRRPLPASAAGSVPASQSSTDEPARPPRLVETTGSSQETPSNAPPTEMDGRPSVSDTHGHSQPESPSGSLHRVLPTGEREP